MRTAIHFSLLFLLCSLAKAQPVVVKGKAPFHAGKEIGIYLYDDLITKKEIKKSSVIIKENGEFELTLEPGKTQISFLKIENEKANLFVEPGNSYSVFFPPKDSTTYKNPNIDQATDLVIDSEDSLEFNSLIIDYNRLVNKFWLKNYQYFVVNRGRAKLDSFAKVTLTGYAGVKNRYFQDHIRYSLASLDYNSNEIPKAATRKYFYNLPVLYTNYEYMQLFHDVFKQYLYNHLYNKNEPSGIYNELNKSSFEGIMDAMASDTLLKERALRELVLLKGLQQLYFVPQLNSMKKNIVAVLEQVIKQSNIEEHKKIAKNILESFSKLVKGEEAPYFELLDKNGKKVSLSDFKGKYVYLDFWATWCSPCLKEMKVMPPLKKKYGNKIIFLSISIDDKIETMNAFLAKNPKYDWVFLHYGTTKKIKDDYGVKAIPAYFLIDPYGKFIQCPADEPSGDIEAVFNGILKKGEKK